MPKRYLDLMGEILSSKLTLREIKYLNNSVEQDHRSIKRNVKPLFGFGSFETAEKVICGVVIGYPFGR